MYKCGEGEGQAEPTASTAPDMGLDLRSLRSPWERNQDLGAALVESHKHLLPSDLSKVLSPPLLLPAPFPLCKKTK